MREKRRRSGNLYCAESSLFYRSTACRLRYLVMWFTFVPVGPRAVCQYAVPAARPSATRAAAAQRSAPSEAAGGLHNRQNHASRDDRPADRARSGGGAGPRGVRVIEFTMVMDSVTKPQNAYQRHGFWRGEALVPGTDGGPSAQAFAGVLLYWLHRVPEQG